MPFIAKTPKPPYYAVIFTSINADVDHVEHTEMYHRMVELAATYDGFLGIEPARNTDGSGVAAIYWKDRLVGRVAPTCLTRSGHRWDRNPAVQQSSARLRCAILPVRSTGDNRQ